MKKNKLFTWITARFPLNEFSAKHLTHYFAPRNFNFWYYFGSFSLLVLAIQIITGIWLAMDYTPTAEGAFASVQYIMRDVHYGWLIRFLHTTGASAFFVVVYLHMYRGLIYGSYQKPRELLWLIGMLIYVTLLLLFLVFIHLVALHYVGSNNPDGINTDHSRASDETIPFHPFYTVKDLMGAVVFLIVFFSIVFFGPDMNGFFLEPENYVPANSLQTPEHIAPVWYMTPFYAILRAIPNKFLGLAAMAAAIALMFVMPWLDRSPVRSIRYKGMYSKMAICVFVISFVGLGYIGIEPVSELRTVLAQFFALGYFGFFLLMPFYTRFETVKALPEQLTG